MIDENLEKEMFLKQCRTFVEPNPYDFGFRLVCINPNDGKEEKIVIEMTGNEQEKFMDSVVENGAANMKIYVKAHEMYMSRLRKLSTITNLIGLIFSSAVILFIFYMGGVDYSQSSPMTGAAFFMAFFIPIYAASSGIFSVEPEN